MVGKAGVGFLRRSCV